MKPPLDRQFVPACLSSMLLAGTALLASCGGGGGGSSGPSAIDDPAAANPEGTDTPTSPGPVLPGTDDPADLDPAESGPAASIDLSSLGTPIVLAAEHADTAGSTFYIEANNAARLQGPIFGNGSVSNEAIGRALPFAVETSASGLVLLQASIYPSRDDSVLIGVVANRSTELHCFIKLDDYAIYDRNGTALDLTYDFAFVEGTVATAEVTDAISLPSKSCIEPGEKAFLSDRLRHPANEIGGFVAQRLESSTDNFVSESVVVEPVSYEVNNGRIEVLVANRGSVPVAQGPSRAIFLDDNGYPLGDTILSGDRLMPGEEGVFSWSDPEFTGRASTIRVVIDFQRDAPDDE